MVPAPGLPNQKWLELYSKWGKYVLEEKKKGFKYYTEKPSREIINAIKKQSAENRALRKSRGKAKVQI